MPPSTPLLHIDAFTSEPFGGNPAAVCLLDGPAGEAWMQRVAAEMNLSETAFVYPADDAYNLRWFTPVAEVDLCGHATLATAHALWETGRAAAGVRLEFDTRSGRLTADLHGRMIELDFPADPAQEQAPPAGLVEALGVEPVWVGRSRLFHLVEVDAAQTVRDLRPDFAALARVDSYGPIVTAGGEPDSGFDFVSRFFAPALGIDEDPVTGAAHCCLTPHWALRLGKQSMRALQASARGGLLEVELRGERVALRGQAVTVMTGELLV